MAASREPGRSTFQLLPFPSEETDRPPADPRPVRGRAGGSPAPKLQQALWVLDAPAGATWEASVASGATGAGPPVSRVTSAKRGSALSLRFLGCWWAPPFLLTTLVRMSDRGLKGPPPHHARHPGGIQKPSTGSKEVAALTASPRGICASRARARKAAQAALGRQVAPGKARLSLLLLPPGPGM